jgi:ATP-dependent RNA helicase DeaD
MDYVFSQMEEMIESEDLTRYIQAIEAKANDSDYTIMDMAAAMLKMIAGQNEVAKEEADFGDTGAEEAGMVRLFINIGKKNKARPGDIVGALAGESGIPGKVIGSIDMFDKYTFAEVPREYARDVLNAMSNTKIKGKLVVVEPANQK